MPKPKIGKTKTVEAFRKRKTLKLEVKKANIESEKRDSYHRDAQIAFREEDYRKAYGLANKALKSVGKSFKLKGSKASKQRFRNLKVFYEKFRARINKVFFQEKIAGLKKKGEYLQAAEKIYGMWQHKEKEKPMEWKKHMQRALGLYEKFFKITPDYLTKYEGNVARFVNISIKLGRLEYAERFLEEIQTSNTDSVVKYRYLSDLLSIKLKMGKLDEAVQFLAENVEKMKLERPRNLRPTSTVFTEKIQGELLYPDFFPRYFIKTGREKEFKKVFSFLLEAAKYYGNPKYSREDVAAYVVRVPKNICKFSENLADTLIELKRFDEALQLLETVKSPGKIGELLQRMGRVDEAIVQFRKAGFSGDLAKIHADRGNLVREKWYRFKVKRLLRKVDSLIKSGDFRELTTKIVPVLEQAGIKGEDVYVYIAKQVLSKTKSNLHIFLAAFKRGVHKDFDIVKILQRAKNELAGKVEEKKRKLVGMHPSKGPIYEE